jgi:hypothetical protein
MKHRANSDDSTVAMNRIHRMQLHIYQDYDDSMKYELLGRAPYDFRLHGPLDATVTMAMATMATITPTGMTLALARCNFDW